MFAKNQQRAKVAPLGIDVAKLAHQAYADDFTMPARSPTARRRSSVVVWSAEQTRRISMASALKSVEPQPSLVFANRTRYLVLALSVLTLTLLVANSLALNFTVICMYKPETQESPLQTRLNLTRDASHTSRLLFNDAQRNWLFSAIAMGSIAGSLPFLPGRLDIRRAFTGYALISAFATALIPRGAVLGGFWLVFVLRLAQGFSLAATFPLMAKVTSDWSTVARSGTFVSMLSGHLQLATIFVMPTAGELCESERFGWQSLYYGLGALTLLFVVAFYIFYREYPAEHRHVSHKELTTIQKHKIIRVAETAERRPVPFRAILTDPAVLGIFTALIGGLLGFQLFAQYGAVYLNKILHFDAHATGLATALPSILSLFVKFTAGPLSDSLSCINDRWRVIIFASVSHVMMAVFFVALALLPADFERTAQLCFTGATLFSGLNVVGVTKSAQLISRHYSFVLMTVHQFISSFMVLVLPLIVTLFTSNNTREEWSRLFIFTAALVIFGALVFNLTAEATPRRWAYGTAAEDSETPSSDAHELCDGEEAYDDISTMRCDIEGVDLERLGHVERALERKRVSIIDPKLADDTTYRRFEFSTRCGPTILGPSNSQKRRASEPSLR